MNKTWILATMALTFAASCSRDKGIDNQSDNNKIDDTTIEEIVLGAGQSVSVSPKSRGIGAVGDLAATNSWNGETVYVYGINKNATGDAQFAINGQAATAPKPGTPDPATVASGALTWVGDDVHYYYNGNDVYDFYGAHVDDAVSTPETNMLIGTGTALSTTGFAVNVTLDGSQDIMVATTDKAADIQTAIDGVLTPKPETGDDAKLYSAWSARRHVIPNLQFKHLLTRLKFQAVCGNTSAPSAGSEIYIDSIKIAGAVNKGSLQIIPSTTVTEQKFTAADTDNTGDFYVKKAASDPVTSKDLEDLIPVGVTSIDDKAPNEIGEDLLLVPAESYDVYIYVSQTLNGKKQKNIVNKVIEASTVTNSEGTTAGKTEFMQNEIYNINIKVYSIEEIVVNATLKPWEEGGNVSIDEEEI